MIHYRMSSRKAMFLSGMALGVLLTGFVYEAKAAPMDGYALYNACIKDEFVAGVYVVGVTEALQSVREARFCIPAGIGPFDTKNAVCGGLHNNQSLLAGDAALLTHTILMREYPCR